MADACDLGNDRAFQILEDALEARRLRAARAAIDNPFCLDCGAPIPLRRRELLPGVETCIDCQRIREVRGG